LPRRASLAAIVALAIAGASGIATAQTFYRWTDAKGMVQYSDVPPKNFNGEVTRVEIEPSRAVSPAVRAPEPRPAAPAAEAKPPEDIAAKRRATREQLEARLERAREKLDAAKKAREDGEALEDDERQVIQQRAATGGQHGMAPRSNCRVEQAPNGAKWLMCPTSVPNQDYFDRIERLDANLRKAEEELAAAQTAWRRGVD
jgi:type IV secretory pathway VirB10-like protein